MRTRSRFGIATCIAAASASMVATALFPGTAHATLRTNAVQSGRAWVAFNGDGTADYCRRVGNAWDMRVQCTVSTGAGFGASFASTAMDTGYDAGRSWADLNGDAKADFCRVVDDWGLRARCTTSTGSGFGTTISSDTLDPGHDSSRGWADVDGDAKADFCRVVDQGGAQLRCTLSTGGGFGATIVSGSLDPGYDAGRAWVDANADGRADYCRVVGGWHKNVSCTLSTGTGFGTTFTSGALDAGYDDGRAWADFNADGRADFCRVIGGPNYADSKALCTVSTGTAFGTTPTSPTLDRGKEAGRAWADFNADGRADYCRVLTAGKAQCTLSTGSGFGFSPLSDVLDTGYESGRAWADFSGDGRADYCRRVGDSWNSRVECTLASANSFGLTHTSGTLDWGYDN